MVSFSQTIDKNMSKKRVAILGSTGTIGVNTLKVCQHLADELEVVGLSVHGNIDLLFEQIQQFHPKVVSVMNETKKEELCRKLKESNTKVEEIHSGINGLIKVATHPDIDTVVVATVGAIGLLPTMEAIKARKQIALANKEVLVMAGELVMEEAKKRKVPILPIDSEHNAIFQCLMCGTAKEVKKLLLTGSGGPFRNHKESFDSIKPEQALKHPTWNMGKKISIDSATLMNKGLEIIECTHLFGVSSNHIEVVIHPQSVIHSMVEFVDGSIIAQLGVTDMYLPIQFALTYPHRKATPLPRLNLQNIFQLTFEHPDHKRFPCLGFGYEASRIGGTLPAVLNAANEIAVQAFLDETISFPQLSKVIEKTMRQHKIQSHPNLDEILQADQWARETAKTIIADKT
jgi:1-deoxy-D-xylulose-5-phosphate reductoisomerase